MTIITALAAYIFSFSTLSVKDYGATGNGTTDDTNAIQSCLTASQTGHRNVVFPAGTYLVNTITGGVVLTLDVSGSSSQAIYGANATILTTVNTACTQLKVAATIVNNNFTISGINFRNTHGVMTGQTTALAYQGTPGNLIQNTVMQSNTFDGYSNACVIQGVNNMLVTKNTWTSILGHNAAQSNNNPAVYLWFADNSNGQCLNVTVTKNTAIGYTGSLPISVPRPMDGFLYGYAYNYFITTNTISMFSQEGIQIQPPTTTPNTPDTVVITGNYVDCTITSGWVDSNGTKHNYNYGIRCDAAHAYIWGNTVKNYTTGIISRPVDYSTLLPTYQPSGMNITGNYEVQGQDTSLYAVSNAVGIYISASSAHPFTGVSATGNNLYGCDTIPVFTSNCTTPNLNNYFTKPIPQ